MPIRLVQIVGLLVITLAILESHGRSGWVSNCIESGRGVLCSGWGAADPIINQLRLPPGCSIGTRLKCRDISICELPGYGLRVREGLPARCGPAGRL